MNFMNYTGIQHVTPTAQTGAGDLKFSMAGKLRATEAIIGTMSLSRNTTIFTSDHPKILAQRQLIKNPIDMPVIYPNRFLPCKF